MNWLQFFGFIITIGGLFFWTRAEANSDRRELANLIKETRNDMQIEMKDFHGRLCTLEEKYINMMQKVLEDRNKKD